VNELKRRAQVENALKEAANAISSKELKRRAELENGLQEVATEVKAVRRRVRRLEAALDDYTTRLNAIANKALPAPGDLLPSGKIGDSPYSPDNSAYFYTFVALIVLLFFSCVLVRIRYDIYIRVIPPSSFLLFLVFILAMPRDPYLFSHQAHQDPKKFGAP